MGYIVIDLEKYNQMPLQTKKRAMPANHASLFHYNLYCLNLEINTYSEKIYALY